MPPIVRPSRDLVVKNKKIKAKARGNNGVYGVREESLGLRYLELRWVLVVYLEMKCHSRDAI
jgi:hypothetical protein